MKTSNERVTHTSSMSKESQQGSSVRSLNDVSELLVGCLIYIDMYLYIDGVISIIISLKKHFIYVSVNAFACLLFTTLAVAVGHHLSSSLSTNPLYG